MMSEPKITRTIIAALPGWYVAALIEGGEHEGEDDSLSLDPIIAWEIERREQPCHPMAGNPGEPYVAHHVTPITTEGNRNYYKKWAIKTPDGKYDIPGETVVDTEAAAINVLKPESAALRVVRDE
jgi:hypothetical protein